MDKYQVNIRKKNSQEIVKSVIIESENNVGIILKGRMALLSDGFRYDKRKHDAGWTEI